MLNPQETAPTTHLQTPKHLLMSRPLCYVVLNQIQSTPEIPLEDQSSQTQDSRRQKQTRWAIGELVRFGLLDEDGHATNETAGLMKTVTARKFNGLLIANGLLNIPEEPGTENCISDGD